MRIFRFSEDYTIIILIKINKILIITNNSDIITCGLMFIGTCWKRVGCTHSFVLFMFTVVYV